MWFKPKNLAGSEFCFRSLIENTRDFQAGKMQYSEYTQDIKYLPSLIKISYNLFVLVWSNFFRLLGTDFLHSTKNSLHIILNAECFHPHISLNQETIENCANVKLSSQFSFLVCCGKFHSRDYCYWRCLQLPGVVYVIQFSCRGILGIPA